MIRPSADCKFCGGARPLRLSHVIPEFVFAPLYDEKHRTVSIPADARSQYVQKGFRQRLLCDSCETFFNDRFEKPFKQFWFDSSPLPSIFVRSQYRIKVPDYAEFKLFHLSVLWRAAVAPDEPFAAFHLRSFEDHIKDMLRRGDAGGVDDFPIFGQIPLLGDARTAAPIVIPPYYDAPLEGNAIAVTIFAGCVWHILVGCGVVPRTVEKLVLQTSGVMRLQALDAWDVPGIQSLGTRHFTNAQKYGWSKPGARHKE